MASFRANWVHVFERKREAPHVPTVNGELDMPPDEEFTRVSVLDSPKPSFKDPNQTEKTDHHQNFSAAFHGKTKASWTCTSRERGNSRAEIMEDAIDDAGETVPSQSRTWEA